MLKRILQSMPLRGVATAVVCIAILEFWRWLHVWLVSIGHDSIWTFGWPSRDLPANNPLTHVVTWAAGSGWGMIVELRSRNPQLRLELDIRRVVCRTTVAWLLSFAFLMLICLVELYRYLPYYRGKSLLVDALLWIPPPVGVLTLTIASCVAIDSVARQRRNTVPAELRFMTCITTAFLVFVYFAAALA